MKFDDDLKVNQITEKVRISSFATIGLYYFKSFNLFQKCFEEYCFENYKEHYLAPIYNVLIDDPSKELFTSILKSNCIHVLGTPEDIQKFYPEFPIS